MPDVRELHEGETRLAATALLELRPWVGEALAATVDRQRADGYRVAGSFEDGRLQAAAVAGFRVASNLAWGHHLYVDDLITLPQHRGRGHAAALFEWLFEEGRRRGCEQFHLDSGVGLDRADAHRFYMNHGLVIASHHFARRL
jgi:GNAT superfamily N-acetyltransferase